MGLSYEFMIKQKPTSDGTEAKYRWIQTVNPFTAVFGDVDVADVTKITTTGYSTHSSYGGIYKFNSSAYFVANNGNNGNWWGAIGAWNAHQGGIPGYKRWLDDPECLFLNFFPLWELYPAPFLSKTN